MSFAKNDGKVMSVRDAQQCALQLLEMHLVRAWNGCYRGQGEPTAKNLYHPIGSDREVGKPHYTKVGTDQRSPYCSVICWRSFVRDWQKIADAVLKDCETLAMGAHKKTGTKRVRTRSTSPSS